MCRGETSLFALSVVAMVAMTVVSAQSVNGQAQPPRDTPSQHTVDTRTPKGRISGRVLTADSGRPVTRARVFLSGNELQRGTLTDDNGVFDLTELPAGRYSLSVSKSGYISLSYGQRRPLQAGTPLQLTDDQELTGIEFRLPRGSALAGHVFDEAGDPLPGAMVRVMRYEYAQGNRQLVTAGAAQTDDQGYYRVWGLNPGEYYVSVAARNFSFPARGGPGPAFAPGPDGRGGRGGAPFGRGGAPFGRGGAPFGAGRGDGSEPDPVGYAPTFYPGVPSAAEARAITVPLGADAVDIDFSLLLVRTTRIAGHVSNADGTPATAGNVNLIPEGVQAGRTGIRFAGRIQWDGAFSLQNVPPGRYILSARSEDTGFPEYVMLPITIGETDITDMAVILSPGATIAGSVTFQNTTSMQLPDVTQLRIVAPTVDPALAGPNTVARVDKEGKFTIEGVPAGAHWIRTQGPLRGWTLKSVVVDGRDVIDTPLELRSGGHITGVSLVFTDKLAEVNGTLSDDHGGPITEYTVLAFPADPTLWRPQARQIMTARPDQNGKYQIRGLPPGEYFLTAVDPAQQGEWFEPAYLEGHRPGAAHLTLGEGDVKTQDFRLANR